MMVATIRPLRIALTVDPELTVPPVLYGGIERVVDMLARNLTKRGHDVTLFAHPDSTCPVTLVPWPGCSSASGLDTLRNAAALARRSFTGCFDLVHSFSRIAYLAPILPLRIPKLMSYQREISQRTTGLATILACGSIVFSGISRRMIEFTPLAGQWHHVPNGVPLETFTFSEQAAPDAPLVFLGRVEEIKGPHLAIEIAHRTGRRLTIAGNVPDAHRDWFDAHIKPRIDGTQIRYLGAVDDVQKNALLGSAAALLMPILWEEPFGIVIAEAMACGTPVLGFRRGAVPEVVEHGVTGFVVDTLDELADAVAEIPNLSRTASRARVERLYSDQVVTDGYERLYAKMVTRSGTRKQD
jgi:glycosyltransferase involved in cell wall biosynthesis